MSDKLEVNTDVPYVEAQEEPGESTTPAGTSQVAYDIDAVVGHLYPRLNLGNVPTHALMPLREGEQIVKNPVVYGTVDLLANHGMEPYYGDHPELRLCADPSDIKNPVVRVIFMPVTVCIIVAGMARNLPVDVSDMFNLDQLYRKLVTWFLFVRSLRGGTV